MEIPDTQIGMKINKDNIVYKITDNYNGSMSLTKGSPLYTQYLQDEFVQSFHGPIFAFVDRILAVRWFDTASSKRIWKAEAEFYSDQEFLNFGPCPMIYPMDINLIAVSRFWNYVLGGNTEHIKEGNVFHGAYLSSVPVGTIFVKKLKLIERIL